MLFGHVETIEDRIDHLRQLRELQDETGGFTGFIPLPYQPENNTVPVTHSPTGNDALRTIAVMVGPVIAVAFVSALLLMGAQVGLMQ